MNYKHSPSTLIKQRFSCRTYQDRHLKEKDLEPLQQSLDHLPEGPWRTSPEFKIIAAHPEDSTALSGLGTYGFIKNPAAFILGKTRKGQGAMEDYGYQMESIILKATDLDLGSCWLGGTFNRSRFADEIELDEGETIPTVTSLGYIAKKPRYLDQVVRIAADSDRRLPWDHLFYQDRFGKPITPEEADQYALPLEMVRLGPSASNKQPWRVIREGKKWHFYLQRTPGYPRQVFGFLLNMIDLQRVDMGIALLHFELTCRELDLAGRWVKENPGWEAPDENTQYIISWQAG